MTAESLKPFINSANTLEAVPPNCSKERSLKCMLYSFAAAFLFLLLFAVIALETWNINRIMELQHEVELLKQQDSAFGALLYELRDQRNLEDFSEFEEAYDSNDIHGSDEYGEEPYDSESDIDEGSAFGMLGFNRDDIETEISVAATANELDGKRKARSIAGLTYQGIPILEESYMNRHHNRSRHHQHQQHQLLQLQQSHHQTRPLYEQMRQAPESTVTPPPQLKLRWDDDTREIPSHHQSNTVGRHSSRRQQTMYRQSSSTSSTPVRSQPSYIRRNGPGRSEKFMASTLPNQVAPDYTTKMPEQAHNRRSRVMLTNADNKYQKVIKNPGTHTESRQPAVPRAGRLMRKSGAPTGITALHLAKYHPHYSSLQATNHANWRWHPVDAANQDALNSGVFKLSHTGNLTVNSSGLYFIYAQITYADHNAVSGFNILVNGAKHASCSVHGQHGKKTNTCYTAALADLDAGSQIEIRDMDVGRIHLPFQEKTFFGLYKLGRRPPPSVKNSSGP